MKIIATGSLLIKEGETLELVTDAGVIRFFTDSAVVPPAGPNEINVNVPQATSEALIAIPSFSVMLGEKMVRHRIGFMRAYASSTTLVLYTFFS